MNRGAPDAAAAARPLVGVALMLLAILSFVLLDGSAKYLSDELSIPQLVWARYTVSFALMALFLPRLGWRRLVTTKRPMAQIGRGMLLIGATASIFTGMRFLPMAEAYAISFVSPAIVAALAIPILGERVSSARWFAIGAGFVGVLVVIRPGTDAISWAVVFPLAMAAFYGVYQIMTRMLGLVDPPLTTLFYTMLVGAAVSSLVVPFFWQQPTPKALAIMLWMGFIGLVGQFALVRAFLYAPASLLAPFAYTQIVWATIVGYLVFGDIPDAATVAGSVIVVASGLLLSHPRFRGDDGPRPLPSHSSAKSTERI